MINIKQRYFMSPLLAILVFSTMVNLMSVYICGHRYVDEYYCKRNEYNKIALTFDDGPHPVYTEKILEILDKYNIKATFFIVGENAGYYKDTLIKISKADTSLAITLFHTLSLKTKMLLK